MLPPRPWVVYDHFGGATAFPKVSAELMRAVDQADSADYNMAEILDPQGWVLLNFLMDPRTGPGRFRNFGVSNYELMMHLIDYCLNHPVGEVLQLLDVAERVSLYREQSPLFQSQLERCTTIIGEVAITHLRKEDPIYAGNRFMVYALNPEASVSVHVLWGRQKQNTSSLSASPSSTGPVTPTSGPSCWNTAVVATRMPGPARSPTTMLSGP